MSTTVTLDDDIAVLLKEELRGRDGYSIRLLTCCCARCSWRGE